MLFWIKRLLCAWGAHLQNPLASIKSSEAGDLFANLLDKAPVMTDNTANLADKVPKMIGDTHTSAGIASYA